MRILCLAAALIVTFPTAVLGIGGPISGPTLSPRSDLDPAGRKQVLELTKFLGEELQFLEGRFINEFSYQRFGGSSGKVAEFISRLQEVGLWQLAVQFRDFGEQESAFSLDENSATPYLRVMINSGREDFKLCHFKAWLPKPGLPAPQSKKGNK